MQKLPTQIIELSKKLEKLEEKFCEEQVSDFTKRKAGLQGAVTKARKKLVHSIRLHLGKNYTVQKEIKILSQLNNF